MTMSLQHTPLEPSQLSPEVQRALGAGPARMMAARGLAPISNPADLITLFYQLVIDPDANIRAAANKSASELPENIVAAALANSGLDPRVLDLFAQKVIGKPELIQLVILNQIAADETIEAIARRGGTREVELVATNQLRLLRSPDIITAMWSNQEALQSTVDKAIELAIHNSVRVPGIPDWDAYCEHILETGKGQPAPPPAPPDDGTAVAAAIAAAGALRELSDIERRKQEEKNKQWSDLNFREKIRRAMNGAGRYREEAIRDNNKVVALAAVKSPLTKDSDAQRWATNSALPQEVISVIADRKEWTKLYSVKLALCMNPKTPIRATARLVAHLRERDLKNLARSKGVPSAVTAQAKKLLAQRATGGKSRR